MLTIFRLYIIYTKTNRQTGNVYVGRASGLVSAISEKMVEWIRRRRENAPHHKNKEGFQQAVTVNFTTDYEAARGYEQLLYEKFNKEGKSAAQNAPVSDRNPKKSAYIKAALALFGDVLLVALLMKFI